MKRRQFLQGAGLAAASTAVAAPAIAESMPELKWRLTSSFPKSLDTIYGAAEEFAKAVSEMTDKQFQIQVFAANEIVPPARRPRTRCRRAPSKWRRPRPTTISARTRPSPSAPRCRSSQRTHAERLVVSRRRQRGAERVLQEVQHLRTAVRQHRLPDGRLVSSAR